MYAVAVGGVCRGSICAGGRTVSVLCLLAGHSDSGFAVVIGTAAIKVGSLPTMFGAGENREHDHPQNSAGEVRRQGRVVVVAGDVQQSPLPNRRDEI